MKGIISILRLGVKYGAYIMVIVRVVQFAIEEIEKMGDTATDIDHEDIK